MSRGYERADLAPLRADADAILDAQRALATSLKGDSKYWFARVYQYVTEGQLALIDSGASSHPDWVLRLIPAFAAPRPAARALRRAPGPMPTSSS